LDISRVVVLEALYSAKGRAASWGKEEEKREIERLIQETIQAEGIPDSVKASKYYRTLKPIRERFGDELRSKAIYSTFKNIAETAEYTEVEVAKAFSSLVTHALIEHEITGEPLNVIYQELRLNDTMYALNEMFAGRGIPQKTIVETMAHLFPDLLSGGANEG